MIPTKQIPGIRLCDAPAKPCKVLFTFGKRAEALKIAPVIKEALKYPEYVSPVIVNTGLESVASQGILEHFGINNPVIKLRPVEYNQGRDEIVSNLLNEVGNVLNVEKPYFVVAEGDSESTFASALSAFFHRIPVGHVEAGLRTYYPFNPFPHEAFRHLITHVATLHFAPTPSAKKNLIREKIPRKRIFVTGNTGIDAAKFVAENPGLQLNQEIIDKVPWDKKTILLSCYHSESYGEPLKNIFDAVKTLALRNDVHFIFPVDQNPNIRNMAASCLSGIKNIQLTEPLDYPTVEYIVRKCSIVMTDSAGLLEEAAYFGKPALIIREITDRPESLAAGIAKLTGTHDTGEIVRIAEDVINNENEYAQAFKEKSRNLFGDGSAAPKIIAQMLIFLGLANAGRAVRKIDAKKCQLLAARWLSLSGIQDANGGIFGYYKLNVIEELSPTDHEMKIDGKYEFYYPEINGYGISTLINLYRNKGQSGYLDQARMSADWIIRAFEKVADGAALPARIYRNVGERPSRHSFCYSYDNGIIMRGLIDLYKETHDKSYLKAAQQIAAFLIGAMKMGEKEFYAYYDPHQNKAINTNENWAMHSNAFHANIAPAFINLYEFTGETKYLDIAVSLCKNALKYQESDGRYITSPLGNDTHAHPHAYTAEGLLLTGQFLMEKNMMKDDARQFIDSAVKAIKWMLDHQLPDGGIPFLYKDNVLMPYERTDASAQALKLGTMLLMNALIDKKYIVNLESLAKRVSQMQVTGTKNQHIDGGFAYGQNETGAYVKDINAWCTMFAVEALIVFNRLKSSS